MKYRVTALGAQKEIGWPEPAIVEEILRRKDLELPPLEPDERGVQIRPAAGEVVDVPVMSVGRLLGLGFIEVAPIPSGSDSTSVTLGMEPTGGDE